MMRVFIIAAVTVGVSALVVAAIPPAPADSGPNGTPQLAQGELRPVEKGEVATGISVDGLIGNRIIDAKGEELATIVDVVMDPGGRIRKVMAKVGGFLGFGGKTVALALSDLQIEQGMARGLVAKIDREALESLPEYQKEGEVWRPHPEVQQ